MSLDCCHIIRLPTVKYIETWHYSSSRVPCGDRVETGGKTSTKLWARRHTFYFWISGCDYNLTLLWKWFVILQNRVILWQFINKIIFLEYCYVQTQIKSIKLILFFNWFRKIFDFLYSTGKLCALFSYKYLFWWCITINYTGGPFAPGIG